MKYLAYYQRRNFTHAQWDDIFTIWTHLFQRHKELMQLHHSGILPEYLEEFNRDAQLVDIHGEILTDATKVYSVEKVEWHTVTDVSKFIQLNELKPHRSEPFRLYQHVTPSYKGDDEPEFRVCKVRSQFFATVAAALLHAINCRYPDSIELVDDWDEIELEQDVIAWIRDFGQQFKTN